MGWELINHREAGCCSPIDTTYDELVSNFGDKAHQLH
jgi:hypothetical protein